MPTSHLDKPQRPLDSHPTWQICSTCMQRNQPTALSQGHRPRIRLHVQHHRDPEGVTDLRSSRIVKAAGVIGLGRGADQTSHPVTTLKTFNFGSECGGGSPEGKEGRSFIAFAMDAFRYHLDLDSSKVYLSSADLLISRWRLPDDAVMTSIAFLAGRRAADLHTHALTLALQQYLCWLRLRRSACGINCGNQQQPH